MQRDDGPRLSPSPPLSLSLDISRARMRASFYVHFFCLYFSPAPSIARKNMYSRIKLCYVTKFHFPHFISEDSSNPRMVTTLVVRRDQLERLVNLEAVISIQNDRIYLRLIRKLVLNALIPRCKDG